MTDDRDIPSGMTGGQDSTLRNSVGDDHVKKLASSGNSFFYCVVGFIAVLATILQLSMSVNHDAAWLLSGAERLIEGGIYGQTVIDVNPPLAWWIDAPAVVLHKLLGLNLGFAFKIYVFILLAVSLGCCRSLQSRDNQYVFLVGTICLLAAGYNFGQREYLMVVLCLPYITLVGLRAISRETPPSNKNIEVNRWGVATASVLGAVGFCIKPHFLAIPIALELWFMFRGRNWLGWIRFETLTLFFGGLIYVASIWIFAPDWIQKIMPQAMSNYGAYSQPLIHVAESYSKALLIPVAALIVLGIWCKSKFDDVAIAFLIAGVGAALGALAQSKGWPYHIQPAIIFLSIAAARVIFNGTNNPAADREKPASSSVFSFAAAAMVLFSTCLPSVNLGKDKFSENGNEAMVQQLKKLILKQPGEQPTVFAMNTSPRVIHSSVVAADGRWIGKACCLHFLPASIREPDDERLRAVAAVQMDEVMSMLEQHQPQILIVDEGAGKLAFGDVPFDYLVWFEQNYPDRFNQWIGSYQRQEKSIGHFAAFVKQ